MTLAMTRALSATVASRVYEPEGTAAAFRLGNLVRSLERAGYQTTVLTTRAPGGPGSTKAVRRWPVLRDRSGAVRGYVQYASFDLPLFFRLLFGRRADVVVAEPPPTTGVVTRVACWLRRTPYLYFSADVTSAAVAGIGVSRFVVTMVTTLERWALRGASGVLAISDDIKHEVIKLGAAPEKVTVVGTGIDTERFSFDGPAATVDYPYFIYAGTMSEFQGAEVFIEAFTKISGKYPTARLRMFGGGVDLQLLKERSKELAHRIDFPGSVSPEEVATWLRGSTASLASIRPGRGYDFAFPTKALASISCGVPVIYAGPGPLAEIVTDNELGWSTQWEADDVAVAMEAALDRGTIAPSPRLANWIEANYSLRAVADLAVLAVGRSLALQQIAPAVNN